MRTAWLWAALGCLLGGVVVAGETGGILPPNLVRQPGVVLTADSHFLQFTPQMAADGNVTDKASRWVSSAEVGDHWIAADFGKEQPFNQVAVRFWDNAHIAVDFDVQRKTAAGWETVSRIRGNEQVHVRRSFPTVAAAGVRILFTKTVPDAMVRIYEFEAYHLAHPVEADLAATFASGMLLADDTSAKPSIRIRNYGTAPADLSVRFRVLDPSSTPEREVSAEVTKAVVPPGADGVDVLLPPVKEYGSYVGQVTIQTADGSAILDERTNFFFFPRSRNPYRTASPVGVHYHYSSDALVQHAGISWWRNHDVYGRWNTYDLSNGGDNWKALDDRLDFVKRNHVRECFVFLGAPRQYSTILPGEDAAFDQNWLYSYYPPSDLDAWETRYVAPSVERVKKASEFRAYEAWNEAWSYYRLRGLHGTAGEAVEIFKRTYDTAKRLDPDAIVYPTDVKPDMAETHLAFKNFGRDIFELGGLRYADLLSYHSYGLRQYAPMERLRRNAWDFGRDFELWTTETATEGKPALTFLESLVNHRSYGNGKAFSYSGSRWAPLMKDSQPTMEMVVQAALVRNFGDGLPLGWSVKDGQRRHLFVNGPDLMAVVFTDGKEPVAVNVPVAKDSTVEDVFGRRYDPAKPALSATLPLFVKNPAPAFLTEVLAVQLRYYAAEAASEAAKRDLEAVAAAVAGAKPGALGAELARRRAALRAARLKGADDEYLYSTNKALDLLNHTRILLARRNPADAPKAPATLAHLRQAVKGQWDAVYAKSKHEGILPNTERLVSRAQKHAQIAAMYESDGDAVARDLFLAEAQADLDHSKALLDKETLAAVYRTKTYFRSHKQWIRSEVYCFPNGRAQEAVVTLANPFGRTLSGKLAVAVPEGWSVEPASIPYEVGPRTRVLFKVMVTAPKAFKAGETAQITIRDEAKQFPTILADAEILERIPKVPVLKGGISGGDLPGN